MKIIKDAINRWRDIPCSWVRRINTVKMTILPSAIYRFNTIPNKSPMAFFSEMGQNNLQFIWKHRRLWITKAILWMKNGAGGINLSYFRLYYKAKVLETVLYWCEKNTNIYIPMEEDGKPREKPTYLWAPYLWQRRQEYKMGDR